MEILGILAIGAIAGIAGWIIGIRLVVYFGMKWIKKLEADRSPVFDATMSKLSPNEQEMIKTKLKEMK